MTLLEKNLKFLSKVNPDMYTWIKDVSVVNCRAFPAKKNSYTATYTKNGEDYYLHSKYDPVKEAEQIVSGWDLEADHVVVAGFGLGHLLNVFLKVRKPGTRVLAIELNREIAALNLHYMDWEEILNSGDIFIFAGDNPRDLGLTISDFVDLITLDKIVFYELASEKRLMKEAFENLRENIDKEIRTLMYDFKTRLAESSMVGQNILKNIRGIVDSRPVNSLYQRFNGVPGFIVSAGPSLDKNILYLKKVQNRAVIIAVDTALKPLLQRGIQPHFTIIVDPSYKNYRHLQGCEESMKNYLVCEPSISGRIYQDFKDRVFTASIGRPLFRMIESVSGEFGELDAWGSVITLAFNFANYIGVSPVVFMGQDFAYTGMRNHCRGTTWEQEWGLYDRSIEDLQRRERNSIGGIGAAMVRKDVYGQSVYTSDKLVLYKNYLLKCVNESLENTQVFNTSEGGIFTEIPWISIKEFIKKYIHGRSSFDFEKVSSILPFHTERKRKKILDFFEGKSKFFKKYCKRVKNIVKELESISQSDPDKAVHVLEHADKIKNELYLNPQNGDLAEMWSQAPIYHYLKKVNKLDSAEENYLRKLIDYTLEYFVSLHPVICSLEESFTGAAKEMKLN